MGTPIVVSDAGGGKRCARSPFTNETVDRPPVSRRNAASCPVLVQGAGQGPAARAAMGIRGRHSNRSVLPAAFTERMIGFMRSRALPSGFCGAVIDLRHVSFNPAVARSRAIHVRRRATYSLERREHPFAVR